MVPLAGFAIAIDALVVLPAASSGAGVHNMRVVEQPIAIIADPRAHDYLFGINI